LQYYHLDDNDDLDVLRQCEWPSIYIKFYLYVFDLAGKFGICDIMSLKLFCLWDSTTNNF